MVLKPCKQWDIYYINWLQSPDFWSINRSYSLGLADCSCSLVKVWIPSNHHTAMHAIFVGPLPSGLPWVFYIMIYYMIRGWNFPRTSKCLSECRGPFKFYATPPGLCLRVCSDSENMLWVVECCLVVWFLFFDFVQVKHLKEWVPPWHHSAPRQITWSTRQQLHSERGEMVWWQAWHMAPYRYASLNFNGVVL